MKMISARFALYVCRRVIDLGYFLQFYSFYSHLDNNNNSGYGSILGNEQDFHSPCPSIINSRNQDYSNDDFMDIPCSQNSQNVSATNNEQVPLTVINL